MDETGTHYLYNNPNLINLNTFFNQLKSNYSNNIIKNDQHMNTSNQMNMNNNNQINMNNMNSQRNMGNMNNQMIMDFTNNMNNNNNMNNQMNMNNFTNINNMNNNNNNNNNNNLMNVRNMNIMNNMNNNLMNMNKMNNQINMDHLNQIFINNNDSEINQIKEMNQINNQRLNPNNFWIDLNQINLINKIIEFYYINNSKYMNLNEKYQIMQLVNKLNPNLSMLKFDNKIIDQFPYITEQKINVKFINYNNKIFNVKIPISIDKIDLYSIAFLYTSWIGVDILLVHNNNIISKDETSIKEISDGDIIIIIENRYYVDDSYYNSLKEKYKNEPKINISIKSNSLNKYLYFPTILTISEMLKCFYFYFGLNNKDSIFLYNGGKLDNNNNEKI